MVLCCKFVTMRSPTATSPASPKLATTRFQSILDQAIPMMTLGPKPCPTIETSVHAKRERERVRYKETPRGPANPMFAPGPMPAQYIDCR
jgi:hypothetical protein